MINALIALVLTVLGGAAVLAVIAVIFRGQY